MDRILTFSSIADAKNLDEVEGAFAGEIWKHQCNIGLEKFCRYGGGTDLKDVEIREVEAQAAVIHVRAKLDFNETVSAFCRDNIRNEPRGCILHIDYAPETQQAKIRSEDLYSEPADWD